MSSQRSLKRLSDNSLLLCFKKGAFCSIKDSDAVGEIASRGEDGTYLVLVGGIKVRVPKEGLEPAAPRVDREIDEP